MERNVYKNLVEWKLARDRKPLILKGARQVGKTYLLRDFGQKEFPAYHYFNFEKDSKLFSVFEQDLVPKRVLSELAVHAGKSINPGSDLVIFDEIQECPKALNSLKYFCEDIPELALCAAGSLLGVSLSAESFPVGKIQFMNLYPLTFEEFLRAEDDGKGVGLLDEARQKDIVPEVIHHYLMQKLKTYFFMGGMPSVVMAYLTYGDDTYERVQRVRRTQSDLMNSYHRDFAKHSGKTNSMHIVSVFENVPLQLSRFLDASTQRYRFRGVVPGKRGYTDLCGPIDWLEKAGLILKVKICNLAQLPLESFCRENIFKLYHFDIGLLGCMLDLPPEAILNQDYGLAKGFFAENFAAQEFVASGASSIYAWSERNSEIEFLRIIGGDIIPVEVKSGRSTQAKSLGQFIRKYSPRYAVKLSAQNLRRETKKIVRNYPLYLAGSIAGGDLNVKN